MQEHSTQPAIRTESAAPAVHGAWKVVSDHLYVRAEKNPQMVDITRHVQEAVGRAGISAGQVLIFCRHTTASVVMNEDEPLLHRDIEDFLEGLASSTAHYRHDDFSIRTENLVPDHGLNAHAHIKHLVLGASLVVPVVEGKLALGTWQRLFMLEMDGPKPRTLLLQTSGIAS
jgi:secondary thiamine-phosphate synthase enzyme